MSERRSITRDEIWAYDPASSCRQCICLALHSRNVAGWKKIHLCIPEACYVGQTFLSAGLGDFPVSLLDCLFCSAFLPVPG